MNFKGESRFDAALVADAGANPASSKHLVEGFPSPNAIAGVIEGSFEAYVPNDSDLSPSSNLVGCVTVRKDVVAPKVDSVCAPPLPNGSMRVFHGAGTTDEENAGRWTNIPEQSLPKTIDKGRHRNSGGSGATLRAVSLRKPAIEKEARLRPQHLIFSRSRMGSFRSDAHVRGVAVALRLPSVSFGSGETRMQMRKNPAVLGATGFCAPPRS